MRTVVSRIDDREMRALVLTEVGQRSPLLHAPRVE